MKHIKNIFSLFALILFAATVAAAQTTTVKPAQTPAPKTDAKPKAAAPAMAALPKADDLINKFVAAIGGEAAYKKLNSYYTRGTMEIPAMGIKGTFEGYSKAPNKNAVTMKMTGVGDFVEVYDGSKGFSADPINGTREKMGEELTQMQRNADFYRYFRLKEQFSKRETKGVEKVDGADAYAVVMTAGSETETYYFDQKTNYLVRIDQTIVAPQGKTPSSTFLSDYRKVEGVMMPFSTRVEAQPISILLKVEEIKANVPVEDAKFAKPGK